MSVMPCSCCGYLLTFPPETEVVNCPACDTANAAPAAAPDADAMATLDRAIRYRLNCQFEDAERCYRKVIDDFPNEHEAYWGRLLCLYGVEYVEDPQTNKRMPTVHSVLKKPLRTQQDYSDACEFAPPEVRARYEQEAEYIDNAQVAIREKAESCPAYDIFLCHKTTVPGTDDKTQDYQNALQMYYYFDKMGYRVFFAPLSLLNQSGSDYEAGIYHALRTAKLMLVFCSKREYLSSPWVRSEWSRYLRMINEGEQKQIVPLLYDEFDARSLPREFIYYRIQGLPMGQFMSALQLTEKVKAVFAESPDPTPPAVEEPKPVHTAQPRETQEETQTTQTPAAPEPSPTKQPPRSAEEERLTEEVRSRLLAACETEKKVTLGNYGGHQLQWRVLAKEGNRVLLLADIPVIDMRKVCIGAKDAWFGTTWERCAPRKWLNEVFLEVAFSAEEKNCIALTHVTVDKNPTYCSPKQGNETEDRLFLLSTTEVLKYLPTASSRIAYFGGAASVWWLRAIHSGGGLLCYVNHKGVLNGGVVAANYARTIRPALWLNLDP